MVKDAELHAEEDKILQEKVETKNKLDSAIYQIEKQLKEYEDKLPEDIKTTIEEEIKSCKEALETDDVEKMKKAEESLMTKAQKMGEEIYKQQTAEGGQAGAGAEAQGMSPEDLMKNMGGMGGQQAQEPQQEEKKEKDGAIDADFEVVD